MRNLGKIEQALTIIGMLDLRGVFDLESGLAEKILNEDTDIEKLKFLVYLQGQIFTSQMNDQEKLAYLAAFTLFMNVVIHGEIDDSEYEEFQEKENLH